ncbi:pterin-4-alpha-carbinolamine dehydratase 2-like [Palaemon carinicauda]|uniref:pterin-4-alpha-carbinolamine dehydratase 2-like n=1 Tax=Palaemon carinicauda TaxID=392227 RepID=UPI0035B648FF
MNSRLNSFNPLWLKDPEFKHWVGRVPNNPHKACCLLCEKDFLIADQGHHSLKAHAATPRHKIRSQMASSIKHERRSSDSFPGSPGSSTSQGDTLGSKSVFPLTRYERDDQLIPLLDNGWNMVDGRDAINKTFLFQSFNEAWSWMSRVALAGERMGHHPEWFNVYNTVQVTWITPECNGITVRDVKMAHFCDSTYKYYK